MMFCVQCGKEISERARFCPHCGAMTGASAPNRAVVSNETSAPNPAPTQGNTAGAGSYTYSYGTSPSYSAGQGSSGYEPWPGSGAPSAPPAPPEDAEKHGKKGLFIGGAVAAVAAVAAVVFLLVSGVFSSPKGRVENAFAKTMSAFSDAGANMGLPDLTELTKSRSVSQRFSMELNSVNSALVGYDMSSLQGLGLSFGSDCDWESRYVGGELAAFWGDNEILSFQMEVDDDVISFASPQFTGGNAYGLNTETLGADLARLGLEDEYIDVSRIGFNLFELAEETAASQQPDEMSKKLEDAVMRLTDAVKVEKNGKKTIEVNGNSVNAAAYLVTVPQEAMEDYIDALSDAMALVDTQEQSRKLLRAIGLDEETIGYMLPDMSGINPYGEMFDSLKWALQSMGDVEFEVYLDGGYVCAVEYSEEQNGSRLELGLYLGGGDNYVDNFSLRFAVDGEEILLESSGDHAGKNGTITDKTTLRARSGGSTVFQIISNLSYEPKAAADNFEWRLNVDNTVSLKMAGQLTTGKDSLNLQLDDVSLLAAGMEICSLSMDYYMGPYQGAGTSLASPTLLGDMDLYDLQDLFYEIEYYAQEWEYGLIDLIPDDLYWAFY